jgi:hypothetical protein
LIGDVVAKHARSTDVAFGSFYQFLRKHGIDPNVEAGYIARKYDVDDSADAISQHDQPLHLS